MAGIAIGTYVKFIDRDGEDTSNRFQNFFPNETRTYNGESYIFGGFGFSGGALDLQGGNISANLVFAVNTLSMSRFIQAVEERWLVKVRTVWLDPETLNESSTHSEEVYAVTGLDHDTNRLSLRLSSPLDAVSENAPRRLLTRKLVGDLPPTGNINLS